MKVLVTGAGGFIGRAIVQELARQGHDVTSSDRPGVDLTSFANVRAADLTDRAAAHDLVRGHDAVVNSVGLFDLGASWKALATANVTVVERLVEACRANGVRRFVHLSSVAVYGHPPVAPCRETERRRPRHPYEITKERGERIARGAMGGLPVSILRPTLVYGPYSRYGLGMFIGGIYLAIAAGRDRLWALKRCNRVHMVHVEDVARAAAFAVAAEADGIFNVADDTPMDVSRMFQVLGGELEMPVIPAIPYVPPLFHAVLAALKLGVPRIAPTLNRKIERQWRRMARELRFVPAFLPRIDRDWLAYASVDHVYDNSKLKALGFRYAHPDFERGVRETIRWYLDRRWLPSPSEVRAWTHHSCHTRTV